MRSTTSGDALAPESRFRRFYEEAPLPCQSLDNDVNVRTGSEDALKESEEKYRLAMEATQDGLWDLDVATGDVHYSPGRGRIPGEEYVPGSYAAWEDRIHAEDKTCILKTLHAHLAGETTAWQEEHRLRHAGGAWIRVLGRGRVVKRDRHGTPCGLSAP